MQTYFLGARLFYWLYLLFTLIAAAGIYLYINREMVKKSWYSVRFPEKLLHVKIFYPGGHYRDYWRLIPEDNTFELDGGIYNYNDATVLKNNTWFAYKDKKEEGRLILNIEDQKYYLDDRLKIKNRWEKWPEIHFIYGCPWPIDYNKVEIAKQKVKDAQGNISDKEIIFNASDFERFKKSTILTQIYAALTGNALITVLVILVIIVLILSGVQLADRAGIIQIGKNITQCIPPGAA